MSTVQEITAAIDKLPRDAFFRLHEWMSSKYHDEWDRQMAEDAKAGRLDHLVNEAIADYHAGRALPFPPDEKSSQP
jgi:hypothetical protein